MTNLSKSMKDALKKDIAEMNDLFNKLEGKIKGMKERLKEIEEILEVEK
jgi:peptidoglycan hydrolase CwlO-like protein